jgi:nicotinic acid phosphoribosyltransferase
MTALGRLYRDSLALLTDLYELTMAYAWWREGRHRQEAAFHLLFRRAPVGLEHRPHELRTRMILEARSSAAEAPPRGLRPVP